MSFDSTLENPDCDCERIRVVTIRLPESRARNLVDAINTGFTWAGTPAETELYELAAALDPARWA